ncbi:MAG: hypothetical protein QM586_17060 [Xenophilus sp.]
MFSLLSLMFRFPHALVGTEPASPAAALLESAGSRAGLDPHQALELREAAVAWLRVVR